MKGLALNTIGVLVIAMVSVLLLLSLVSGTLKDAANWLYCKVYIKLLGFFQGQELGSIPEVCKIFYLKNQAKEVEIKEGDNTIFSRKLLALIIACWKEAEIKGLYEDHPCYQIRIKTRVEDVTEKNVSDILINEDHCTSIENSDYGCGYYNQILWKVDGAVNWLTKDEIASLINSNVLPSPSPIHITINRSMIPSIYDVKSEEDVFHFVSNTVPKYICDYFSTECDGWDFNESTGIVSIKISGTDYSFLVQPVVDKILSKGKERMVLAINSNTHPSQIPVSQSDVEDFYILPSKLYLEKVLKEDLPRTICDNNPNCFGWYFNETTNEVKFEIGNLNYTYSVDTVISYMEKNGWIDSSIRDQKIILIEYNGKLDVVEVVG